MAYMFDILAAAGSDGFDPGVLDQRPFVQRALRSGVDGPAHKREARNYRASGRLRDAVNTAVALGHPLLLTGAPGTGKTQAAYWIAERLKLGDVLEFQVKSGSTSADLVYEFEAVRYMADSMREQTGQAPPRSDFLLEGPLWTAFESDRPRVLLVDEIDKAPRDFPNDLLREFDQWTIEIAELREGKRAGKRITCPPARRPIVVITSNGERPLPDPFLRRCVFHHIELSEDDVREILFTRRAAGDFPADDALVDALLAELRSWRARGDVERLPGIAELLNWLGLMGVRGIQTVDLSKPLPSLEVLLKTNEDQERVAQK